MKTIDEIKSNIKVRCVEQFCEVDGTKIFSCSFKLKNGKASVMFSCSNGLEHVSISPRHTIPSWEEMCEVKDAFFYDDEIAIQIHPRKADYINIDETCLHLWRWSLGGYWPIDEVSSK